MRWLALVLAIGCAPPRVHRAACRRVRSHSDWRARLASDGLVVDPAQIALGQLAPVAIREVAVSPSPGAPSLGAHLEPGFVLPATPASWLHVHADHPIAIDGWVPASARGVFWQPPPVLARLAELGTSTTVRVRPDAHAPVAAVIDAGVSATIDGEPGEWARIDTIAGFVGVAGWALLPPPRPVEFDFSDDVIEGELVHPEGICD